MILLTDTAGRLWTIFWKQGDFDANRWGASVGVDVASWRVCGDNEVLPPDMWRDAWVDNAGQVSVDLDKARRVHMRRLLKARADALNNLDVKWMRAIEDGRADEAAAVVVAKQKLRDLPTDERITNASSVSALEALTIEAIAQ